MLGAADETQRYYTATRDATRASCGSLGVPRQEDRHGSEARPHPGVGLLDDAPEKLRRRPGLRLESPAVALLPNLPGDQQCDRVEATTIKAREL